ncbi:uncharacterized protein LOC112589919 [Harpegnathos saltator]|uniref:uncharacterized protein LOC112589919 n=1 Tax=Harpegnathos saltator TaxID=610380 RepID=UPI000DBED706|nr:uncharacterized protein LOC112589919 [Harpegnathos saltator]
MYCKLLYSIFFIIILALMHQSVESKKVVIHVPYRVKNVKHTHTIYKLIPHYHKRKHDDEDDVYRKR